MLLTEVSFQPGRNLVIGLGCTDVYFRDDLHCGKLFVQSPDVPWDRRANMHLNHVDAERLERFGQAISKIIVEPEQFVSDRKSVV